MSHEVFVPRSWLALAGTILAGGIVLGCGGAPRGGGSAAHQEHLDQCKAGNHDACTEVATDFSDGRGVARDPEKARAVFEATCTDGSARACKMLGGHYKKHSRNADSANAWERACGLGDTSTCALAGIIYMKGKPGVAIDKPRAAALFEKGCRGTHDGHVKNCRLAGATWFPIDAARAKAVFTIGCDGSDGEACSWLGKIAEDVDKDPAAARARYEAACKLGAQTGCKAVTRLQ